MREIYSRLSIGPKETAEAIARVNKIVSYKWNVVEILPNLHFETYMLEDWGNAFHDGPVYDAWAGSCFGMRDHFAILQNGDVTLCCIDFKGNTAIGNLNETRLEEILSSDELGRIIDGFKRYKPIHPYCKRCLGSKTRVSWLTKPVLGVLALGPLKSFFYKKTRVYSD